MSIALPLIALVVLIVIGAPVAYALLISGVAALFWHMGWAPTMGLLNSLPHASASDFLLTTVPMFVLMAELLSSSRIATDIYRAGHAWVGHMRGGLAVATVLASAGFASLSGSSPAAAATMSSIAVPEMRKYGYNDRLSLGVVASAGTLAIMIPPSIVLILYGILTEQSIGRLFVAGFIPGVMTAVAFVAVVQIWTRVQPSIVPGIIEKASMEDRVKSLKPVGPALLLILTVLGGIYSGLVTPEEAGALGAAGALIVGIIFSGLRKQGIGRALRKTGQTTAMIFTIVISASLLSYFLIISEAPQDLITWVEAQALPPMVVLMTVLVIYVLLGAFLDPVSMLILTLPLVFPLITSQGFDPIWFGIIATMMVEIGLVTPPVGINVFVAAGTVNAKLEHAFVGALYFVIAELCVLTILILFPELTTYLPDLLFGPM